MHTVSSSTRHTESHEQADGDPAILEVQFDDLEQQKDSSILGMWLFLATEVMFFGGLITAYAVYRTIYHRQIELASQHMFVGLGFLNTVILLTSSLTMALAVRASQLARLPRAGAVADRDHGPGDLLPRGQGDRVLEGL